MANETTHYTLRDYDTLESIAARYLGDPERWTEIVQANNLRYPFISLDPKDHLGPAIASGTLGSPLLRGASTFTLPLNTPQLAEMNSAFHVSQLNAFGTNVSETKYLLETASLAGFSSVTFKFTTPMEQNFDSMANWVLIPNPHLQSTRVLRPGDTILLYNALTSDKTDNSDEFTRMLGADILLDDDSRQLHWDSTTHDYKLTRGVENLAQAVRLKIMTNLGDLAYHPDYGNRLLQYIGVGNTALFGQMAGGLVRECVMQDPRIYGVENVSVVVRGDVCIIDLSARVRGIDSLVEVTSLGIRVS